MSLVCLHERGRIEGFLRGDPLLHLYALGDLDPFLWRRTTWYGWEREGALEALVLVYAAPQMPAVLAYCDDTGVASLQTLLSELRTYLPRRFHLQSSPGVVGALGAIRRYGQTGHYLRMGLDSTDAVESVETSSVETMEASDNTSLLRLYETAYPGNWFDPSMLETGAYRGIRRDGEVVAAGGVHAVSETTRVAALGNIAVSPEHRGQGLATRVTAAIVQGLLPRAEVIGLNVAVDNAPAIRCYEKLGFRRVAVFEELTLALV